MIESLPISIAISFVAMWAYFQLATKYQIVDKPNERSSHSIITLRGGGVIFPFVGILSFVYFGLSVQLTIALLLVSIISILDDLRPVRANFRLLFHFIAFAIIVWELYPLVHELWILPVLFVVCIGAINAYNFMDGINGLTGLYSLAMIISFIMLNQDYHLADQGLFLVLLGPLLVFLFYNYRKKAKCFAGDVGSVSIALVVVFFMLKLILISGQVEYIFLMGLYGVDSILTIIERLYRKENIFKPHRRHLYQLLANECSIDHRIVSLVFFVLQLSINVILIKYVDKSQYIYFILIVYLPIIVLYFIKKYLILNRFSSKIV